MAAVQRRFGLPAAATGALDRLLELIAADPTAPTAVVDVARAIDVHVADALVSLQLDAIRGARRIADIGSGAGFPGIVLAAALPAARVALVESNGRKCDFLARAAEAMGLQNVEIVRRGAAERARGVRGSAAGNRRDARGMEGPS
jgi:16S rRNA (guanine527-N7)-methyltransferase